MYRKETQASRRIPDLRSPFGSPVFNTSVNMNNSRRIQAQTTHDPLDYSVRHPSSTHVYQTSSSGSQNQNFSSTSTAQVSQSQGWNTTDGLSWGLPCRTHHGLAGDRHRHPPFGLDIDNTELDSQFQFEMACPLFVSDPQRYRRCLAPPQPLTSAAAVREHLATAHQRPFYCPACGTIFKSASASNRHIEAQTCSVRVISFDEIEGVPEDDMARLNRWEPQRSQSEEERWYSIWEILFPGVERPSTPYLSRGNRTDYGRGQE
ncbi:hypothetical protein QBC43DRAFT_311964 [Cladorrhinum sp. PSN259]|nr:hypothetical protein QBC43DRAFT_311964 [Cladorrhinum sp. PSN259]